MTRYRDSKAVPVAGRWPTAHCPRGPHSYLLVHSKNTSPRDLFDNAAGPTPICTFGEGLDYLGNIPEEKNYYIVHTN